MPIRRALAFAPIAILLAGCSAPPSESEPAESREQPIVGGMETPVCGWPTTVSFSQSGAGCTATLVHPKVISIAAHCVEGGSGGSISFGDTDSGRARRTVPITRCVPRPNRDGGEGDFAFCVLSQEVNDIPIIPFLAGCETSILKPGQEVALVGFGFINANTPSPGGHKRWVKAKINQVRQLGIDIGDPMHQNCFGDSGGPAFVQLADGSWRVFGATSTTSSPACASEGTWALSHPHLAWVEQQSGVDVTPCHDAATGMWNPGPKCTGVPLNPEIALGTWANNCTENLMLSGPLASCGNPIDGGTPGPRDAQADNRVLDAAGEAGQKDGGRGGSGGSGGASGGSAGVGGGAGSAGTAGSGGSSGGGGSGTAGAATSGSAGATGAGTGGTGSGAAGSGNVTGGSGGKGATTPVSGSKDEGGCACRAGAKKQGPGTFLWLLLGLGCLVRRLRGRART
jgi:hypothetical protein